MRFRILIFVALALAIDSANSQESSVLDIKFSDIFRRGREIFTKFIQPKNFRQGLTRNIRNGKSQRQFSNETKFFCDVSGARSKLVPKSVHMLRPGDIDVVAAIGDSLTAGNGMFALDVLQILVEGRGASWAIGGFETWRTILTVPNILKEFNPKLYGFSESGTGHSYDKSTRFNVAEGGAMVRDTPHQARNLVKRMRSDPKVNLKKDWKLVTYMIGSNDFCLDICYYDNQDKVLERARADHILALRILRENLPRTMVNVVLPPDVTIVTRFVNRPDTCKATHYGECPCLFSLNQQKNRDRSVDTIRRWQLMAEEVVNLPEFHDRGDFEVNLHPLLEKTDIPRDSQGRTDFTYMSTDCFHLSQKGHARAANSYYNSMMTPEKQRARSWSKEFETFRCPTQQHPFLFTTKNS